jgi:toxin HigB-1
VKFKDRDTERFWNGERVRRFEGIAKVALRKLDMLAAAPSLETLQRIPGNRLEALKGDRAGQYSVRVNDQWRLCFTWTESGPADVEIVDYH